MHRLETEDLGTVLGVWAHPDDEAYLSAGLMGALRDAGRRVVAATATYGEHGTPDPERFPPVTELDRKVAAVRAHASQTAGLVEELGEDDFRQWWATESFVAARTRSRRYDMTAATSSVHPIVA